MNDIFCSVFLSLIRWTQKMFEKKNYPEQKKTEGMGEKCFKFFVTKLSIKNTKRKKREESVIGTCLCVSVIFEGKKRERKNEKSLLRHPPSFKT
jgi:hypothetical protein